MTVGTVKIQSGEKAKALTFSGVPYTTTATTSDPAAKTSPFTSFQVVATSTSGNVSTTVQIQVSNDDVTQGAALGAPNSNTWLNYGTAITISSAASPQVGGFPLLAADMGAAVPWRFVRANVTALTGTGAQCYILMGT